MCTYFVDKLRCWNSNKTKITTNKINKQSICYLSFILFNLILTITPLILSSYISRQQTAMRLPTRMAVQAEERIKKHGNQKHTRRINLLLEDRRRHRFSIGHPRRIRRHREIQRRLQWQLREPTGRFAQSSAESEPETIPGHTGGEATVPEETGEYGIAVHLLEHTQIRWDQFRFQ